MSKRPSFLHKLAQELPAAAEPVRAEPAASNATAAEGKPGRTKSSIYLSDPVMNRLREIAFTERRRVHDLFLEGIDRVIESRGHPERSRAAEAE